MNVVRCSPSVKSANEGTTRPHEVEECVREMRRRRERTVSKKVTVGVLSGFVLLAIVCASAALKQLGFSELPDGHGELT